MKHDIPKRVKKLKMQRVSGAIVIFLLIGAPMFIFSVWTSNSEPRTIVVQNHDQVISYASTKGSILSTVAYFVQQPQGNLWTVDVMLPLGVKQRIGVYKGASG